MAAGEHSLHIGDALTVLRSLPAASVNCCVTSPPYWGLRDYGVAGQIGLESTPDEYVARLVAVFAEVRRVLRDNGTLWLNIGDSYAATTKGSGGHSQKQDSNAGSFHASRTWQIPSGLKPKDLVGIPWRVAFALQADGWYLRSDIIWSKPNPMPESVTDRPTKSHEYVFLLSKSKRYYYDAKAIAEPSVGEPAIPRMKIHDGLKQAALQSLASTTLGTPAEDHRNARTVWTIATQPYPEAHFAVMPLHLARRCILAGCPESGTVLDPFMGAGTVALAAQELGRRWVGIELNPEYASLIQRRAQQAVLPLAQRTED